MDHPIPLTIATEESKHSGETPHDEISMTKRHSSGKEYRDGYGAPDVKEEKKVTEAECHSGIFPGNVITNLLEFRMKKWVEEGARITIATPFIDSAGLKFIFFCIQSERALVRIYTREICGWNNKKIDKVIAEAELPGHWFANKVVSIKKTPSFHAKFLAGEHENKVELILTSCNFTSEHLFSDQLETVMFLESSVKIFHSDWLRPLEIMAEKEGNVARFLNMHGIMQEVQNIK